MLSKILILNLVIFITSGSCYAQSPKGSNPLDQILTMRLSDVFSKTQSLNFWVGGVVDLSCYSQKEIERQRMVNLKVANAIVTDSWRDSTAWTEIEFEDITPYTWKWLDMEMVKKDGSHAQISLRRPNWWIKQHNAGEVGNQVFLDMPEMGLTGKATIVAVRINQLDTRFWDNDSQHRAQPITGKFIHQSREVWNLYFEGQEQPLCITSTHRLWSVDKNKWVEASRLIPGERVETYGNSTKLLYSKPLAGNYEVYNLEVYRDHNYYVTRSEILAHNHCLDAKKLVHMVRQSKLAIQSKIPGLLNVKAGQGFVNRRKIKDLFDIMTSKDAKKYWDGIAQKNNPIVIHRYKDGVMIAQDGHHRFLSLSAASKIEGTYIPDLNDKRIFMIKDYDIPSTGRKTFDWDKMVEMDRPYQH